MYESTLETNSKTSKPCGSLPPVLNTLRSHSFDERILNNYHPNNIPSSSNPYNTKMDQHQPNEKQNLHKGETQNNNDDITYSQMHCNLKIKDNISSPVSDSTIAECLQQDGNGNLPAMVAALRNNQELLLSLLSPFIRYQEVTNQQISDLIHHRNTQHQCLLEIVMDHQNSMSVSRGILIQLEGIVHNWDLKEFQKCIKKHLGTSLAAMESLEFFNRITPDVKSKQSKTFVVLILLKTVMLLFFLRSFFYLMDVVSDCVVLYGHFEDWQQNNSSNLENLGRMMPFDNFRLEIEFDLSQDVGGICQQVLPEYVSTDLFNKSNALPSIQRMLTEMPDYQIPLECYPEMVSEKTRFVMTAFFILMPTLVHLFEMAISPNLKKSLDEKTSLNNNNLFVCVFKLITVPVSWIFMPFITFFREFWVTFRFETAQDLEKVSFYRSEKEKASMDSSRVKIIEICTESSFQPLFQLYLVYLSLMKWVLGDGTNTKDEDDGHFHLIVNHHWREMFSIFVSILSLSWGYTSHYRRSKDGALGVFSTMIYFGSTLLFVIARILSFELFAYYLGPGNFMHAMITVGIHIFLMSVIDFVFSYSVEQCQNSDISSNSPGLHIRDLYNCLINGLANIFVYNDITNTPSRLKRSHILNGASKHSSDQPQSTYSSKTLIWTISDESNAKENCSNPLTKKQITDSSNVSTNKKPKTLVRQFIIETILLLENIAMLILARRVTMETNSSNNFEEMYNCTLLCIVVSYFIAMLLKLLYYSCCHPWSKLIRDNLVTSILNK